MSEVILAMSACRTSITEIYQSGGTGPGAGNWGCENVTSKFVAALTTDDDGVITATIQNVSASVNGSNVTLIPLITATTVADTAINMGQGLYGWVCGNTGTTIDKRYLPGSCRGTM
jgi:type IV pilus assembly protein PilA